MHEFAVFKTLGYGALHLASLVLGEALVVCAAGGALGIACTFPALRILAGYVGNIFPVLDIRPTTLWLDVLAVVTVALVASGFPIRKVLSTRIVDALGRVA
jgi:putative ABC transport system permease protein